MANSLLSITPHKISRSLKGYSVMLYGAPKTGKTTTASKFPGALVLAFEKGYLAIPGIMAKPMNSWNDFKKTIRELNDLEVKEIFQTIVIDTSDIAYSYCEKYICGLASDEKNTYDSVNEIPFGKGFAMTQAEFDECLRKIIQMDYGLVLISHATDKTFKDEQGNDYNQIVPTLNTRGRLVCERTCDIIGYSCPVLDENGNTKTKLYLRGTPRFVAGSRFRYTPPVIDFNYDNLVKAINDAIDMEEKSNGMVTNEKSIVNTVNVTPNYDFNAMMEEFKSIVDRLMKDGNPSMAQKITNIVDEHLGTGRKVSDCTSAQAPQLDMILFDLRRLV